jgi:hypothetical protein
MVYFVCLPTLVGLFSGSTSVLAVPRMIAEEVTSDGEIKPYYGPLTIEYPAPSSMVRTEQASLVQDSSKSEVEHFRTPPPHQVGGHDSFWLEHRNAEKKTRFGVPSQGWCVDAEGKEIGPIHTHGGVKVDHAIECWDVCRVDVEAMACAYHEETSTCTKYHSPKAAGGNGREGYECQIKESSPLAHKKSAVTTYKGKPSASYDWGEGVEQVNPVSPKNLEEAEAEVEKFDKVVVGAAAEAGIPDPIHTPPPSTAKQDAEDVAENEEEALFMWVALGLVVVCCLWTAAWGVFFARFKSGKAPEEAAVVEGETAPQGEMEDPNCIVQ